MLCSQRSQHEVNIKFSQEDILHNAHVKNVTQLKLTDFLKNNRVYLNFCESCLFLDSRNSKLQMHNFIYCRMCNERIIATHTLELYWPLKNYFPTCVGRAGKNNKNTQAANLGPAVYEGLLTSSNLMGKTLTFLYFLSLTGRRPRKFLEISHGRPLSKPYLQIEITFPSQSKL
jgi:hypothetical protein